MANIFCPTCGAKSTYNLSPPNFCGKCGLPYAQTPQQSNRLSQSKLSQSRFSTKQTQNQDDDYEDDDETDDESIAGSYYSDSNRVPRISKLSVDIDSSTDVKVFKFSDFISDRNIDERQ